MTHVVVVPSDRGGCGYFRLIWPAQAVSAVRPDWQVSIVPPEKIEAGFHNGRFFGVRGMPDPLPDLLVMQRVGTLGQFHIVKWAYEQGIATVVDFDDAMWAIDKDNLAWKAWNKENQFRQHWKVCEDSVQYADLVTCTTKALATRYGRQYHRTEILPNCIPRTALDLPRQPNETFTAGWAGFTKTHPGDCRVSAPAAQAVLDAGGHLRVVADAAGAAAEWGLSEDQVDSIPPQKLGPDYFTALGKLDLMLVGLRDTKFNQAKSFLKVLEAASQGVPSIAPANAPHRHLASTGFPVTLAATPGEWADAGKVHATMSLDERQDLSNEVKMAVAKYWTIEGRAEHWASAWERAIRRRGGTV